MILMLELNQSVLVLVDVQGKLATLMHFRDALVKSLRQLIQGAQVLGLPIVWLEQNPAGLGPTIPEIAELLGDNKPIAKFSFSACGEERFLVALGDLGRRQVLLAGIETHVCVYQTAIDLLARGYEVQVVADAVSSRTPENKKIGLQRMCEAGVSLTSVEMALFELVKVARGDVFKKLLGIVK
jgi:nicotinamidase-related amidase